MKRYISKLLLALTVFLCLTVILMITPYLVLKDTSFKESTHKNILFLGNSLTECSINDQIINRSINLARSADASLFSYIKLKRVIADNPQIDTVILNLSGEINKSTDEKWLTGPVIIKKMQEYPIIIKDFDDTRDLATDVSFYIGALRLPMYQLINCYKKHRDPTFSYKNLRIGGYLKLGRTIDSIKHKEPVLTDYSIDTTSLEYKYICKIIDYCTNADIKLILLHTPFYKGDEITNRKEMHDNVRQYFPNITFLDFSDFPIGNRCPDLTHLNTQGAKMFSEYIQCYGFTRDSIEVFTNRYKDSD